MFVRRVKTNSSSRGPYFSFRLCQAVRAGSKVRPATLLNLGADFPLPRQRWHEFAGLVEILDRHQQPLFPPDPQLLSLARRVADRLRQRRLAAAPASDDAPWAFVRLNSLAHPPFTSVGGERVALAALEALQLPRLLRSVGLSERHASVATALLMARMLQPASELAASPLGEHPLPLRRPALEAPRRPQVRPHPARAAPLPQPAPGPGTVRTPLRLLGLRAWPQNGSWSAVTDTRMMGMN